jgi:putative ABC transport system substrate-binding protein
MRRRDFILVLGIMAISYPDVAGAQKQPVRLAFLGGGQADSSGILVDALKLGLRENGLVEGHDYVLDIRWAEGDYTRFTELSREVVAKNPSAILVTTIAAVRAAQRATATIPIIMTTINDPVGTGLIKSLGRPGGNTTGLANLNEDLTPKLVDILRAVLPGARRVAALFNPANASNPKFVEEARAQIGAFGATLDVAEFRGPLALNATFEELALKDPDALFIIPDIAFLDLRERIVGLALEHRVPVFSTFPEFTDVGALVGYGPSRLELYRRSAYYVKRILDGAKAADLPVEQPSRIELSLNLRTAKTLDISIPDNILGRADKVIE